MDKKSKTRSLFSKNIIRLRKEAGLSQKSLAKITGITHNFMNDLENNKKGASFETIDRLAEALGIEPIHFFTNYENLDSKDNENFLALLDNLDINISKVLEHYRKGGKGKHIKIRQ